MFLLDDLFFWLPINSLTSIANAAKDLAEKEMEDMTGLQEELLRYEALLEIGKITPEQYFQKEKEVFEKMKNRLNK